MENTSETTAGYWFLGRDDQDRVRTQEMIEFTKRGSYGLRTNEITFGQRYSRREHDRRTDSLVDKDKEDFSEAKAILREEGLPATVDLVDVTNKRSMLLYAFFFFLTKEEVVNEWDGNDEDDDSYLMCNYEIWVRYKLSLMIVSKEIPDSFITGDENESYCNESEKREGLVTHSYLKGVVQNIFSPIFDYKLDEDYGDGIGDWVALRYLCNWFNKLVIVHELIDASDGTNENALRWRVKAYLPTGRVLCLEFYRFQDMGLSEYPHQMVKYTSNEGIDGTEYGFDCYYPIVAKPKEEYTNGYKKQKVQSIYH
jgi:hypothetical protein